MINKREINKTEVKKQISIMIKNFKYTKNLSSNIEFIRLLFHSFQSIQKLPSFSLNSYLLPRYRKPKTIIFFGKLIGPFSIKKIDIKLIYAVKFGNKLKLILKKLGIVFRNLNELDINTTNFKNTLLIYKKFK